MESTYFGATCLALTSLSHLSTNDQFWDLIMGIFSCRTGFMGEHSIYLLEEKKAYLIYFLVNFSYRDFQILLPLSHSSSSLC